VNSHIWLCAVDDSTKISSCIIIIIVITVLASEPCFHFASIILLATEPSLEWLAKGCVLAENQTRASVTFDCKCSAVASTIVSEIMERTYFVFYFLYES